jgi:tRNA pseudouridine55 synthase
MNGVLIIDKPSGLTSHDVVARARRLLGERSIGHLGTLDPMATGVLPLVIGSLTRLAQFYTHAEKTYEGVIRFGFATDTYDSEGEPTSAAQPVTLDPNQIHSLAARFRGYIEQVPPPFSAKKIHGVPAYKLARKRKEVSLQPVRVEVKEFEILSVEADRAQFRARVTSGTYMRSVAHDMGQALGCGAHLESLRRTAVAEFTLADAHTIEELEKHCHPDLKRCHPDRSFLSPQENESALESLPRASEARRGGPAVLARAPSPASPAGTSENSPPVVLAGKLGPDDSRPVGTAETLEPETLDSLFVHPRKLLPQLPSVTADEATAAQIRFGRTVNLPELSRARQVKVFSGQRDLIAIATRVAGTLFHPKIVLCGSDTPARRDGRMVL